MSYGELYLAPVYTGINKQNGRFLKGHIPHNKGKKWSEYMSKRNQKRCAKGWKNLDKYRPKERPDQAGRCRKQVVAVFDDGRWMLFPCIVAAAEWLGCSRSNIGRCCRQNKAKKTCKHNWRPGQPKGASRINTDHRYMGIRWYFETDDVWTEKISK